MLELTLSGMMYSDTATTMLPTMSYSAATAGSHRG